MRLLQSAWHSHPCDIPTIVILTAVWHSQPRDIPTIVILTFTVLISVHLFQCPSSWQKSYPWISMMYEQYQGRPLISVVLLFHFSLKPWARIHNANRPTIPHFVVYILLNMGQYQWGLSTSLCDLSNKMHVASSVIAQLGAPYTCTLFHSSSWSQEGCILPSFLAGSTNEKGYITPCDSIE